jgi:hypothetical protein
VHHPPLPVVGPLSKEAAAADITTFILKNFSNNNKILPHFIFMLAISISLMARNSATADSKYPYSTDDSHSVKLSASTSKSSGPRSPKSEL